MVTSTADGVFNLRKQLCFVLGLYKGLYKKIYVWRLKSNFYTMNSPTYDLGSLCSSPLLYAEGEDFLGQPVNVFEDEDITFDFIDSFEGDFSIAGSHTKEVPATGSEQDQTLITERTTLGGGNEIEGFEHNNDHKRTINEESCGNKQVITSNNDNGDSSIHDYISVSECFDGVTNEVTNGRTENLNTRPLSKKAGDGTQYIRENADENNSLSQTNHEISGEKLDIQDDYKINTSLSPVQDESPNLNYSQKIARSYPSHEKTVFLDKIKLPSQEGQKTSKRDFESQVTSNLLKKTNVKKVCNDSEAFCVKTSTFKRCIPPKTFYSPFWTPEKSTARQERSLEDSLLNAAQRNVDILYCYNCTTCGSKKPHVKKTKIAVKTNEVGNKYTDFLKRRTVFKQHESSLNHHNKDINGEPSCHLDDSSANNDKWTSLPAIYTSKPKTAHNKPIGASTLSFTSIEELIKKYKGHRFDLVEQQKRYKLKPFK